MSGRCSSSSLGTGDRDAGAIIEGPSYSGERLLSDADLEAGSRLAAEDREGMEGVGPLQLDRGNLGLGGGELGFGLGNVEVGGDAALAAVPGQFKRTVIGDDGFPQHLVLGVERAEGEIVNGDLGLNGELGGFEVIGRGSQTVAGAFDFTADAAPEIEFPGGVERDEEGVKRQPVAGGSGARGLVGAGALAGVVGLAETWGKKSARATLTSARACWRFA